MRMLRSHTKREREREKEKEREREEARERERAKDKISELPESLVHHIFSFLPIKSVVSTSLLSTKWRYLWTSIPIIDLRNWQSPNKLNDPEETNAFMRFVDKVLSVRRDVHSPSIKKFYFSLDTRCFDKSRANEWISTVVRLKVEELVIIGCKYTRFPPCLFTCESLTLLEIDEACFQLPESVSFPKLKILRINVVLNSEHFIQKLLSNSPILEEFSLGVIHCEIQDICICGPNLRQLLINGPLYWNCNIQINAPNLQSFRYAGPLAKDFHLHNFLGLVDAEIVLSLEQPPLPPISEVMRERRELGYLATKLFASLSNAKRLRISDYSLELLSYQDHFQIELPSFHNLVHLEFMSPNSYFGNEWGKELPAVPDFLHISPNLESLIFANGFSRFEQYNNYGFSQDLVPKCLLLHLKSIEFRGFFGKQVEMDLLKLFLIKAKLLQKVRISISGYLRNSTHKEQVKNEILLFRRSSDECVLHVS